ncbi:MAG: DUF2306 domain-containing protein [Deltaproteobacteria bacterium]|nr:DUF2306 domain-containing protein [Deltaproteobacteria bacterium]
MMNIASTPSSPPSHDAREVARSPLRAWLTPALLLALATVPSLVGVVRLVGLAAGGASSPDNARLDAHPVPLALHIAGSTGFAVLGALQFAPHLQRRRWHRVAGRLSVILGVVGALAAMWLAIEVPASADDAPWLRGPRFAAGAGMLAYLLAGFAAGRRDVATHRAWMTRAYALALGGGTQVFTAAPYLFLCKSRSPTIYSLLLVAGWVINLAVAEWVLFAERSRRVRRAAITTLAAALVLLAARPAHAEDRARVGALLETAAEAAHDGRVRSSAEALSAGVLFAGAGVASWVTTSAPEDRSARDVVGGVLVGVGGALILGSTYTLVAPSDLERQSGAWIGELRTAGPEATDAIVREADRMLVARARAAKTERVAEGVAAFVFAALEIGGGLVLQARSDDPGLVWLGRGLVAGGAGAAILGVAHLAVRSEEERVLETWQRERALPEPPSRAPTGVRVTPQLGLGTIGLVGTF